MNTVEVINEPLLYAEMRMDQAQGERGINLIERGTRGRARNERGPCDRMSVVERGMRGSERVMRGSERGMRESERGVRGSDRGERGTCD